MIFRLIYASGIFPFIPKYLETQFYFTTSQANLITGNYLLIKLLLVLMYINKCHWVCYLFLGGLAMLSGVGMVLGGGIQSVLKLRQMGQLTLCVLVNLMVFVTQMIFVFISCPDEEVKMNTNVIEG